MQITKPTLLLDKSICLNNIDSMSSRARKAGLGFRPHCKTHQSREIANWFRDFGVTKITVSSFDMATYFAADGWQDILVAFPFNPLEINRLNKLSSRCRISVLLDQVETIKSFQGLEREVGYYIDIDTGYGRTGVKSDQIDQAAMILQNTRLNKKLMFSGFYCHAGHSYKAKNSEGRNEIHVKAITDLQNLKIQFSNYRPKVLYGDTPNCSMQKDFNGIDEITPGNFVFYDLMQASIGSCRESDIAVALICPVVGKYPDTKDIVIHGGAVHFSKESMMINGQLTYGRLLKYSQKGWSPMQDGIYINSLTQEHGCIQLSKELFSGINVGDLLAFHPLHSCLTANLMKQYTSLEGEVIDMLGSG
jgi:D-serine deaminase-like pyridoxal phosphate-dependent protein